MTGETINYVDVSIRPLRNDSGLGSSGNNPGIGGIDSDSPSSYDSLVGLANPSSYFSGQTDNSSPGNETNFTNLFSGYPIDSSTAGVDIQMVDSFDPDTFQEGGPLEVVDTSLAQNSASDQNYYQIDAYVDNYSYGNNIALNALKVPPNAANNLWNQYVDTTNTVLHDSQYIMDKGVGPYIEKRTDDLMNWAGETTSTINTIVKDGPTELMNFLTDPDMDTIREILTTGFSAESWEKSLTVGAGIGLGNAGSAALGSIKGAAVVAGVATKGKNAFKGLNALHKFKDNSGYVEKYLDGRKLSDVSENVLTKGGYHKYTYHKGDKEGTVELRRNGNNDFSTEELNINENGVIERQYPFKNLSAKENLADNSGYVEKYLLNNNLSEVSKQELKDAGYYKYTHNSGGKAGEVELRKSPGAFWSTEDLDVVNGKLKRPDVTVNKASYTSFDSGIDSSAVINDAMGDAKLGLETDLSTYDNLLTKRNNTTTKSEWNKVNGGEIAPLSGNIGEKVGSAFMSKFENATPIYPNATTTATFSNTTGEFDKVFKVNDEVWVVEFKGGTSAPQSLGKIKLNGQYFEQGTTPYAQATTRNMASMKPGGNVSVADAAAAKNAADAITEAADRGKLRYYKVETQIGFDAQGKAMIEDVKMSEFKVDQKAIANSQ